MEIMRSRFFVFDKSIFETIMMKDLGYEIKVGITLRASQCHYESIVGSVVECSPATRAARVRFPDDAILFHLNDYNVLSIIGGDWTFNFVKNFVTRLFVVWRLYPDVDFFISFICFSNAMRQIMWHFSLTPHKTRCWIIRLYFENQWSLMTFELFLIYFEIKN